MKCALCGYEFGGDEGQTNCPGCPLAGLCSMVRCPNCGYDNPRGSKVGNAIHRMWHGVVGGESRGNIAVCVPAEAGVSPGRPVPLAMGPESQLGAVPLDTVAAGGTGRIAGLTTREATGAQRLLAMGVVPGSPFKLLRSFPAYVLEVGFTQVAVDDAIAQEILVRLDR